MSNDKNSIPHISPEQTSDLSADDYLAMADAGRAEQTPANANVTPQQQFFRPLSLADLMQMPPKVWLVEQVMGVGDLCMIYGAPASGKTFGVIDLILSVCTGKKWAGRFEPTRALNVAYCAGEGISGLAGRFQAAAEYHKVDAIPNLTFYAQVPQLFIDIKSTDATESILQFVAEWKHRQDAGDAMPLDILVIDTYHSATAGTDENSAQHAGTVVRMIRKATVELGCAVVLVHHSNKAGTGERGSSALRGAMDCMIEVKQHGNKHSISCEKLKDGAQWLPQEFELIAKSESARIEWLEAKIPETNEKSKSKRIVAFLKEKLGEKFTAKQLAELAGTTDRSARNLLSNLVAKNEIKIELHEVEKPPSNKNPWVYFVD